MESNLLPDPGDRSLTKDSLKALVERLIAGALTIDSRQNTPMRTGLGV